MATPYLYKGDNMASKYTAHTWKKADIVTTDLFNHIENGVQTNAQDIDALTQQSSTLASRMDEVVAIADGDITTSDAELVDVRVAYGGDVYESAGDAVRSVGKEVYELKGDLDNIIGRSIPNGFVVDGNKLYLAIDGNIIGDPIDLPEGGGGGGGGSSTNAQMTAKNTSGWISKTISYGASCSVKFTWSSIEDELPTGNGSLRVVVNGSTKSILDVRQGEITVDVTKYLTAGENKIRLSISDVYGSTKNLSYTINTVDVSIKSSFDASQVYSGDIKFTYIPNGKVEKTVHFIIDGTQVGTQTSLSSGNQLTYTITGLTHGSHSLRVYFDCEIDGAEVTSNELYYEIIYVVSGNNTPIITSNFNGTTVDQYSSVVINYNVYTPDSLTSEVTLSANGTAVSTQTVDRTTQTWSYKANTAGNLTLEIATSNNISKTFNLTVTPVEIDVHPTTDSLELYLTSYGRSNNEAHPETWTYNDIEAQLTNFNFTSDGWQLDSDNNTMLRVAGDARVTIPLKIFANDFRTTGKTIEFEFSTTDVRNYDATILSCMNANRGISLTAQKAMLKSEQSEISTQYKEDEHVRIGFVVEKRSEYRLIFIYINGIMSGVVRYPENDDFSQPNPVDITIGSNDCTINLYYIRVYENDLTRQQMLNNWIADTQNAEDMLYRYHHNDVYDEYGNIVIAKLPSDLPYMIIHAEQLPQYKGDKKTVSITYVDPTDDTKSFTAENVQADVQGTSSQYYARKNYKLKYKSGFKMTKSGEEIGKYALRDGQIPVSTFTMKADVASSEGANNVELVRLYNNACPYKTPAQVADERVRQGIDGFPIVMFWDNGLDTTFLGKQ